MQHPMQHPKKFISYAPIKGFFNRYALYKGTNTRTRLIHHMVSLAVLRNNRGEILFKDSKLYIIGY